MAMSARTGRLYLIPNTLDFGLREQPPQDIREVLPAGAIEIAARLTHWVAENAKTTRAFLKRVNDVVPLAQPLQSLQIAELPRPPKGRATTPPDLMPLLEPAAEGHDIGLHSEAGLPAVADPGALLVAAAHRRHIEVVPLSGPSSLLMALAASGLNGQSFAFVGYLPVGAAERSARLKELEAWSRRAGQTQIVIETPYRNPALLDALLSQLQATTRLSVSCGLTLAEAWTRSDAVSAWRTSPRSVPADIPAVFCFQAA
jgi:16S rRNA (cytidine1402-2'-O)-methyltransferase